MTDNCLVNCPQVSYVTKCEAGHLCTEAQGKSRKWSKKHAAKLMLEELQRMDAPVNSGFNEKRADHQTNGSFVKVVHVVGRCCVFTVVPIDITNVSYVSVCI